MKKTFLAILVAATLVACAKEDVISQNNEAIGFKQAFVDNSVRSVVDPSFSNTNLFDSFAVYGTVENAPLFNKVEVSGSELNGEWTYEGTQYWIAGAKYNFAAIAPYAKGVVLPTPQCGIERFVHICDYLASRKFLIFDFDFFFFCFTIHIDRRK